MMDLQKLLDYIGDGEGITPVGIALRDSHDKQVERLKGVTALYQQLMDLVSESDAFYFSDAPIDNVQFYRIFSYRLASYTEFLKPGAMEARGIMFLVRRPLPNIPGDTEQVVDIAARPMEKFFNIGENPLTLDLDYTQVQASFIKEDGSLISTYSRLVHGMGEDFVSESELVLGVKSKTSVTSSQALAALAYIKADKVLHEQLLFLERRGYTVNCEWCAPDNRIVVGYMEPKLIILNARHRYSGQYLDRTTLEEMFPDHLVPYGEMIRGQQDIERLRAHTGYEGVILQFNAGYKVNFAKFKNDWYLHRHRTKDSVNNPAALFDAILHEAVDDLKTLFLEDALATKIIDDMEQLVIPLYNRFVRQVEDFHAANLWMERKDYAIAAQQQFPTAADPLNKITFGAIMQLFQGQVPNYKELLSKHKRHFIREVVQEDE